MLGIIIFRLFIEVICLHQTNYLEILMKIDFVHSIFLFNSLTRFLIVLCDYFSIKNIIKSNSFLLHLNPNNLLLYNIIKKRN